MAERLSLVHDVSCELFFKLTTKGHNVWIKDNKSFDSCLNQKDVAPFRGIPLRHGYCNVDGLCVHTVNIVIFLITMLLVVDSHSLASFYFTQFL